MITARIAVATALRSAISSSGGARFEWLPDHTLLLGLEGRYGLRQTPHLRTVQRRNSRHFVDCRHYCGRRGLMHHMAGARNAVKRTLDNVGMKSARLFVDVDQPVFLARDDADGHL